MSETIVLDPSAVATGRTEFDISGLIQVAGVDWGDAEISAYMAEATRGQVPVDYRVPNRTVTIPLVIKPITGLTYDQARQKMQAKVGLIHREGGWLKRIVSGTPLYADVVNATLKLGGSGLQALRGFDVDATLSLECLPEFYGDEITLDDMTETTAAELVKVLKASTVTAVIKGDYPARTRIVVDEDQAVAQRGLIWGLRSRYYDSAATAALAYEAEALTPLDAATIVTQTGSSGGGTNNAVKHPSLTTDWRPVLSTTHAVSGALTHKGTYRVWARVSSPSGVPTATSPTPARPRVRFVWDVGDLTVPAANSAVTLPSSTSSYVPVDLGEVRLDAAPVGTHRWFGMVQAAGATAGQTFFIDKLWFVPVDDGYGVLRYAVPTAGQDLSAYAARDSFDQTAGVLTAKTLPIGGTWAGAGDADDFSVTGSGRVQRTAVSDGGGSGFLNVGRMAIAGSTSYTNVYSQVTAVSYPTTGGASSNWGVFARYIDVNNWVACQVVSRVSVGGGFATTVDVMMDVAGTVTHVETYTFNDDPGTDDQPNILRMYVEESGRLRAWFYREAVVDGSPPILDLQIGDLATGGTLASGKVGFYDQYVSATAGTRVYDDFLAWAPTADAVIYASQSAQLRSDGMIREDSSGTSYGPMSSVVGDLPRLPPSGIENRTVELFLKGTRGDLDQLADTNIDDISAQVFYRPCWLFVPA